MKLKDAEHYPAKEKLHEESFLFVHNYGGSKASVRRHVKLVNDLGYNAYAYSSSANGIQSLFRPRLQLRPPLNLHQIWHKEVTQALNEITGPKILMSFSYPSAAAIETIVKNGETPNLNAWICDGGPFLNLEECFENLYRHYYKLNSKALFEVLKRARFLLGGVNYRQELLGTINQLPKNFPVLSIRSTNDKLVPEAAITEVFRHQNHLDLEIARFASDHLMAARDFNEDYKNTIQNFLSSKLAH